MIYMNGLFYEHKFVMLTPRFPSFCNTASLTWNGQWGSV